MNRSVAVGALLGPIVILSAVSCSFQQAPKPDNGSAMLVAPTTTDAFPVIPVAIDATRGIDPRVKYAKLLGLGPWDDRNYQLTKADTRLLKNDADLEDLIPAYYRVKIRKQFLERNQRLSAYPPSSLARFLIFDGGYRVGEKTYQDAERTPDGLYRLVDKTPVAPKTFVVERPKRLRRFETRITEDTPYPYSWGGSAIAIAPHDPNLLIAAALRGRRGQQMYFSTTGGDRWEAAARLPLRKTCCNPSVAWSADGTNAYAITLGEHQIYFYRSGDHGRSWSDLPLGDQQQQRREIGEGADQAQLHVDADGSSPHKEIIHLAWHEGLRLRYSRSTDRGATWSPPPAFKGEPLGSGGDITTDSRGNVYYFYVSAQPDRAAQVRVLKSTDGGISFAPAVLVAETNANGSFPIPAMTQTQVRMQVSAVTDRNRGIVYATWTDTTRPTSASAAANHARVVVARSADGGATWETSSPPSHTNAAIDHFNPAIGIDLAGWVHLTYNDTGRDPTKRQVVDLVLTTSQDHGQTWGRENRHSSNRSPEIRNVFGWGSRNGLDVRDQVLMSTFTDNHQEGRPNGGDSIDIYSYKQLFVHTRIFASSFESGTANEWSSTSP